MFKYETHMHTAPVSVCAKVSPEENMLFYKEAGFDGVFVTNHFKDGILNYDESKPYSENLDYYFSDYEKAFQTGKEIGLKVFFGIETSVKGTDFLVYGLDKEWFLRNEKIVDMKKSEQLNYFRESGALVIQAHPFRRASYIDHIRLFPDCIDGVEVFNACRKDEENEMALLFADHYKLLHFAGSDNHKGRERPVLAGMCSKTPVENEQDFVKMVKSGEMQTFRMDNPLLEK